MFCKILIQVCLIQLFVVGLIQPSQATHLMGGELTYQYDGAISGGAFYNVKLIVYRYCDSTLAPTAPLDTSMFLGVYTNDPGNPANPLIWFSTETLTLISSDFIISDSSNSNCTFSSNACIERGEYFASILLPDNAEGYYLFVERCCRNGNIINLDSPGAAGMSYYTFIPPGIINSSPQITDISVPYMCLGDTVSLVNNATDPDGDSLVYSFVVPYNGYSSTSAPIPDPFIDNNPYFLPIPPIIYAPGYSVANMLGAGGYTFIDPLSGLTKYYFPSQGFYVAAIEIREFRNGVQISSIRRDLQFISIVCTPNLVPNFGAAGAGTIFTVGEGASLCFNVSFSDPDGDSLFLAASGPVLNSAVVNPPGVMPNSIGDSVVASTFCWTPACGTSRSAPYQVIVTAADNGCPPKSASVIYSIYVTPGPASLTASVSIAQSPPGIICQNSQATFVAVPILSGTAPQYFWTVNGVSVGTNDSLLTISSLNNGDVITVMMISNATCLLNDTANSPPYIVTINPQPGAQVNITSNPSGVLCPQQICLFTANVTNAGITPVYQWNINGVNSGTNSNLFTAASPSGLMSVYVTLAPSTGCPPQQSNVIVFNIQPQLEPEILLTANIVDSICPGQEVVFEVTSQFTGAPPVYDWLLNGMSLGISDSILVLNNLKSGDEVNVSVTSSYPCLSPDFTFAQPLVFYLYDSLKANLTDGPLEVCNGQSVSLATAATGGKSNSYSYSWSYGNLTTPQALIVPPFTDYYFSYVDDNCYGTVADSIFIEVLPAPVSDFYWSPAQLTIFDMRVNFTDASTNAINWQWNLGDSITSLEQNLQHTYSSAGIYNVSLVTTNDVGCTDTLVKQLEIENIITAYVPNSFTPNGDGKNDNFGLIGFSTGGYEMSIFNRWGQVIFTSSGAFDTWNGKSSGGSASPQGVYSYLIRINNDTSKKPIFGTFSLIR